MERLTTLINGDVYYSKGKYAPTTLCAEMSTSEIRECMHSLSTYEDTGLTADEIGAIRLDNKFLQNQNKEFREEILKLKEQRQRDISELQDLSFALIDEHQDKEYWEREAKKWCIELGKIKEDAA